MKRSILTTGTKWEYKKVCTRIAKTSLSPSDILIKLIPSLLKININPKERFLERF
jgi:hypothetical protein